MTTMTLLIDRRNSTLALKPNGVVEVRYANDETHRVGLNGLRRIIVNGDVQVSSSLLRACQQQGVAILLTAGRGKGNAVHLFPENMRGIQLRHAQHCCYADPIHRIEIARQLVKAKIWQQYYWLEQHGEHAETVRRFLESADQAHTIESLMGVEGAAAARYFMIWGKLWPEHWQFRGRNRRPPRDPVNALISLGYALALSRIGQMAAERGMDLGMGFLHSPFSGRPSLTLDLLEPARPWVDEWTWRLVQNNHLHPGQFSMSASEGCRLDKEARAIFFREWHKAEDEWLPKPARSSLALVLNYLRRKIQVPDDVSATCQEGSFLL